MLDYELFTGKCDPILSCGVFNTQLSWVKEREVYSYFVNL